MGTNFYRIPNDSDLKRTKGVILEELGDDVGVHLGKRSCGWLFCWNFHNNLHYSNKKELINFIKGGRIFDEYGAEVDPSEFIKEAINWGQPDGWYVCEEYYIKEFDSKNRPRPFLARPEWNDKLIDGLRVSSSIEFS